MSTYSRAISGDLEYRKRKRQFKIKHPYCQMCGRKLAMNKRTVDHIVPMWMYEGSPYDQCNWQVLCETCHEIKTRLEGSPLSK